MLICHFSYILIISFAIYMSMKNDVSFLLAGEMNFYEHQSTYNPNMPARIFIYAGRVYNKFIHDNKINIYSSSVIKLPVPRCICFYNGSKNIKNKTVLKLSDSFSDSKKPDIEVKITMYNINYGNNKKLLNACKPLAEYSYFVDSIRKKFRKNNDLTRSVNEAIDMMPEDSILKPILNSHRAEVMKMCVLEYTQEKAEESHQAEINKLKDEALKEKNRADSEKSRADSEKSRADSEKNRADNEKSRADSERNRADNEKIRADKAEKNFIDYLRNSGKTDEEIKDILHQNES